MFSTDTLDVDVTADTSAYAAGDCVGGLLTANTGLLGSGAANVILNEIILASGDTEEPQFDIFFFDSDPSTGSTFTDNSAMALTDAAREKIIHVEPMTAKYADSNGRTYVADNLTVGLDRVEGHNLYVAIVARGAITYAAATDLHLRLKFARLA